MRKTDYFCWISEGKSGYIRLKNQKSFPGGDESAFGGIGICGSGSMSHFGRGNSFSTKKLKQEMQNMCGMSVETKREIKQRVSCSQGKII